MIFKYTIQNLILSVAVFMLQIMVFNNINVYGIGFPMIYMMAILLMPVKQPPWLVLIAAFLMGLGLDFFSDTGGLHAAATTFMGFARIFTLNRMEPQAGYAKEDRPGLGSFRIQWVVIYFLILILAHHLFYFILEEGSLRQIGGILFRTIVSSLLSLIVMMVLNIFLFRK